MKMIHKGLTDAEVLESRKQHGTNQLPQVETETFWQKFFGNLLGDPVVRILIVALVINTLFVFLGYAEWVEPVGIAIAVLVATLFATLSEHSNEGAFQKLQEDASKITVKVYRNGHICEIMIDDIVAGDEVLLQTGDMIPADGYLIDGQVDVDQASLNGESKEAHKYIREADYVEPKDIDFLDVYKMFRGTVVVAGDAVLKVETVGEKTFYGALAKEMQTEERDSPLTVKLGKLADGISKFGYIGGSSIAVSYMINKIFLSDVAFADYFSTWQTPVSDLVNAIILAVIIIVVAVPEGLPMMISMVLSLNMRKMLKDNVLVRKLIGIESSGGLQILCTDKTGTITKGELEVIEFYDGKVDKYKNIEEIPGELKHMIDMSILHNTSAVVNVIDGVLEVVGGNSTEKALMKFAHEGDKQVDYGVDVVGAVPFNSANKYSMAQVKGVYNLTLIKGAPEKLLKSCKYFYNEDGGIEELTDVKSSALDTKINELADRAIRVLAFATSKKSTNELGEDFDALTFVGIVGIRDDVRPEAIEAIAEVKDAGIQVIMITGDRKETAVAISKEAGILTADTDIVLTSQELNKLTDDELKEMLPNLRVIARALPTDKSRLVRISQELNLVVGMTGDGVNDAPALKRADVGFAMGSGTEVAKEAGDIVILDDNFKSIAQAVLYGRTIYNSIRKFIVYQLTVNVGAILIAFLGPFIGVELPLSMTQMLWVNLVMDTLAALAFGGEPALREYMNEKPKKRDESILDKYMWSAILTGGVYIAGVSIAFLLIPGIKDLFRASEGDIIFLTGFFSFFILLNGFNTFNARTREMNLFKHITENKGFLKVVALIFIVQFIMTIIGGDILRTAPLNLKEWLVVLGFSATIIPLDLIRKAIINNK